MLKELEGTIPIIALPIHQGVGKCNPTRVTCYEQGIYYVALRSSQDYLCFYYVKQTGQDTITITVSVFYSLRKQ